MPQTRPKRKATEAPEVDTSSESKSPKETKAHRASTDVLSLNAASSNTDAPVETETAVTTANAASVSDAAPEETLESFGALIQDLFHPDNAKVKVALDALKVDLDENKKKCENIRDVGGCFALVQLVEKCLEKAIEKIPACDQVTKLDELVELDTMDDSIIVLNNLMDTLEESPAVITAIGGVEAVVKVMKTFPKCLNLQYSASIALLNFTRCNVGKKRVVEAGGITVLLAAVNNHLDSVIVCEMACSALVNIANGSKENMGLLISLGGAAVVAKVRTKWPDYGDIQKWVRQLATLIEHERSPTPLSSKKTLFPQNETVYIALNTGFSVRGAPGVDDDRKPAADEDLQSVLSSNREADEDLKKYWYCHFIGCQHNVQLKIVPRCVASKLPNYKTIWAGSLPEVKLIRRHIKTKHGCEDYPVFAQTIRMAMTSAEIELVTGDDGKRDSKKAKLLNKVDANRQLTKFRNLAIIEYPLEPPRPEGLQTYLTTLAKTRDAHVLKLAHAVERKFGGPPLRALANDFLYHDIGFIIAAMEPKILDLT